MAKIYLPTEYINKPCKVVNQEYVRVFDNNNYTSWTDIYYTRGYYLKQGSSQYGQSNVTCDSLNSFTDNIFYRYDLANSLLIFFIIAIVCLWFPYNIFSRAFGRWLKV